MDLPETSRLYGAAIAAAKSEGYPDPMKQRFVQLPDVLAAYINQLATANKSQWPAEKLRAAISWHYAKPEMLSGGHPHDRWVIETQADGSVVLHGNPARSAAITQILAGLSKAKKNVKELLSARHLCRSQC
ncbi:uncharacterized protein PITG_07712 [Phytophthora infestans T30-4]|uniref:Uncharacterized protein n=1 Tax=Phytophthora infestans (strain T30-4) TaxID=403677 RepID=D0N8Y4_PHYIT|nr:uncharacterized protein PITG_07712 [Phytophthora infestans T30-4]EEY54019.1 conserved hypothetical protein [Phytophthora infestans T30-4]|eukprot:XP_002904650.1 conserved hypothetical protein [Phytophthora infestans T30-4]